MPPIEVKDYRRLFLERVPLGGQARAEVLLSDPWDCAEPGEHVEAWGFRLMQDEGVLLDRAAERYRLIRTHRWDSDVISTLRSRR